MTHLENRFFIFAIATGLIISFAQGYADTSATSYEALLVPDGDTFSPEQAKELDDMTRSVLAPAYSGLAGQIVSEYGLAEKKGIGIDIGGGPGALVIELCKRTKHMYWINADINTHNFAYFCRNLDKEGLGDRAGAIFADAHALPFRDNYADIVVSRGTLQFWKDKKQAFSEILRVLKPGGAAFIGRGLPDAMPAEQARVIRKEHGHGPKYDPAETEKELQGVMESIGVRDYKIRIHSNPDAKTISYGIWVEFRKRS